ncbi:MAG: CHASE domain-containing protein [Gammaproteobacteria bacterium]|nr:CHASE domain-containing protein [Gammaproteobacteria bacterium]
MADLDQQETSIELPDAPQMKILLPVAVIGILLSLLGFFLANSVEQQRIEATFAADAQNIATSVSRSVGDVGNHLRAIEAFYHGSESVTRDEFAEFSRALMSGSQSVQALEWIPRVTDSGRLEFETAAALDGLIDFQFTEYSSGGELVRRSVNSEYFPVYFVEPVAGNETALGFDLASNAVRLAALSQSMETRKPLMTARITLVQESAEQKAVLVFWPIFRQVGITAVLSPASNADVGFEGFALGVFRIGDLLQKSLGHLKKNSHEVFLFDLSAEQGEQLLASNRSLKPVVTLSGDDVMHGEVSIKQISSGLYRAETLDVVGRQWLVVTRATPAFWDSQQSWTSIGLLVAGLLVTGMTCGRVVARHRTFLRQRGLQKSLELEVDKRTAELKQATVDLSHSESLYRAMVTEMRDGYIVINRQGEIEVFNPAAEAIFGYTAEQVIGQQLTKLMPRGIRDLHPQYVGGYKTEPGSGATEMGKGRVLTGMRADGDEVELSITVSPLVLDGRDLIAGLIRDVTEERLDQREKAAYAEALQRSNTELEQFAYVASHDLQEPLRMINSYLQLIRRRYSGELDEQADKWIDYAVEGSNRMKILIQDLLAYSRIASDAEELVPVDLDEIVRSGLHDLENLIDDRQAQVTFDPLPTIMGDPNQLLQLLVNLVSNGIKYCDAEQQPRIHISAEPDRDKWRIQVSDNGIGIEDRFFVKIFTIFQRLHGRSEYSGTGIGLAICKRIVEHHGGRIWLTSTPGEGTQFFFTLASVKDVEEIHQCVPKEGQAQTSSTA